MGLPCARNIFQNRIFGTSFPGNIASLIHARKLTVSYTRQFDSQHHVDSSCTNLISIFDIRSTDQSKFSRGSMATNLISIYGNAVIYRSAALTGAAFGKRQKGPVFFHEILIICEYF